MPQFVPSEIHAALAELPFSLILTTCQDDLMAHALQAAGKAPIVQRYHIGGDKRDNPEFLLSNSPKTPLVYHLFGHAHEPGSLVLSENDLLDFLIAIVSDRPQLPQQPAPRAEAGHPELSVHRFRDHAVVSARAVEGADAIA